MRRMSQGILFVCVFTLLSASALRAEDDRAKIVGSWEGIDPTSGQKGGFDFKADGTVQTYTNGKAGPVMNFEVDLTKQTLDLIAKSGKLLLLCKLEGGKLTIESGDDAGVRPKQFDPKKAIEFTKKK